MAPSNRAGRMTTPALSTRVDKTRLGRDGPSSPSIDRVTAAARDVDHAAQRLAEARDGLAAAIRESIETGYSLRTIAGAARLSHEAVRRYRWRAAP